MKKEIPPLFAEGFVICQEQIAGRGEDFFLCCKKEQDILMGVFDGCGGSGGRVYSQFENHTGAYVAARALSRAVEKWFAEKRHVKKLKIKYLKEEMDSELDQCKAKSDESFVLLGSLKKEFPSTMAVFTAKKGAADTDFYWCGDSRGYTLDRNGLHQITEDDVPIKDAMKNLREDAPMTNVASASHPYKVHHKKIKLENPTVLLTATDGCFSYLPTPMEFEKILLETLMKSSNMEQWRDGLIERIGADSGDDFTMGIYLHGFETLAQTKNYFIKRFDYMANAFSSEKQTEETLFRQWELYRENYEIWMNALSVDSGE